MNEQKVAPVKMGEIYEVSINAVGAKGDGIAKVKGFVIFVPGVQQGDFVKIRIAKVLASVGFGEVVEKLERLQKQAKFATVTKQELEQEEDTSSKQYEDTENFGEEK